MPDTAEFRFHLMDAWRVLVFRRGLALAVAVSVLALGWALDRYWPRTFEAAALFELVKQPQADGPEPPSVPAPQVSQDTVLAREVLLPVVEQFKLKEIWARPEPGSDTAVPLSDSEAYELLSKQIEVHVVADAKRVRLTMRAREPGWARKVVEAVVASVRALEFGKVRERVEERIARREKDAAEQDRAAAQAEAEFAAVRAREELLVGPQSDNAADMELWQSTKAALGEWETQLREARAALLEHEKIWERIKDLDPDGLEGAFMTLAVQSSQIELLQAKRRAAEANILELATEGYGAQHPKVDAAQMLADELRQQRDELVERTRDGIMVKVDGMRRKLKEIEAEYAKFKATKTREVNQASSRYRLAAKKVEDARADAARIHRSLQAANDERSRLADPVRVLSDPREVELPVLYGTRWNLALAATLAAVLALLSVALAEWGDRSVKNIEQLERAVGAVVMAVIPEGVPPLNKADPGAGHAEGYRILRAKIEAALIDPSFNALTAVSGGAGEGKSTTLFNLAYVFAHSGQRVLLIDGDLRRPTQHQHFGMHNADGFSELLRGEIPLERATYTGGLDTLHFMPSGRADDRAFDLVSTRRFTEVIDDLKNRYDWVLVDSPPILGVSDASVFARVMDGVIMVVQPRRYPLAIASRVRQAIDAVHGQLLGVVFNKVDPRQHELFGYYTSYYSYYHTGDKRPAKQSRPRRDKPAPAPPKKGSDDGF